CPFQTVCALLGINRHLTRSRAKHRLSKVTCRYQLAENIRACRFMLCFVLFDSLITVTDVVADIGFNLSILFELAIPWALVTVGHESYRNRFRRLLCARV
ncbi:hypothetical protein PFISCL1PPCAC_1098, partial [Pristionchus fissidentatus]